MKDLIFTVKKQKRELFVFLLCFVVAFTLNVIAILIYKTQWSELITSIGYVFCLGFVIYAIIVLIRLIVYFIYTMPWKKTRTK
jgi:hypothetical protein